MYSNNMTADAWLQQITIYTTQMVTAADTGKVLSDKFNAMVYGLTDAQILALPQFLAWKQADLTAVKAALSSLINMSDALHNNPIAQGDRYAYFAPFLLG